MPKRTVEPPSSEITAEAVYLRRREWMRHALLTTATAAGVGGTLLTLLGETRRPRAEAKPARTVSLAVTPSAVRRELPGEALTSLHDVTTYNNFYEFGTDKSEPAERAGSLRPRPWSILIEGEVKRAQRIDIDTLLKWLPVEERVYRMRCVEGWSMVIPWLGFSLAELVRRVEPTSRAKYLAFDTLLDPDQMPEQRGSVLPWPYVEGLRIDEATHPLALMAVGLYGKTLPNQNGAPIRLVVPWKYGFKGIKSIVRIRFTATQPLTTWNLAAPDEYGFYANVNPEVDHPRWSQRTERRIGELERRITLPFNGYGEEIAGLYGELDLRRNF